MNTEALIKELLGGHCDATLKETAEKWLAADEAGREAMRDELIAAIGGAVCTVDEVIEAFGQEDHIAAFGADVAAGIKAHAEEIKAQGVKYCDCPACTKAIEILHTLGEKMPLED